MRSRRVVFRPRPRVRPRPRPRPRVRPRPKPRPRVRPRPRPRPRPRLRRLPPRNVSRPRRPATFNRSRQLHSRQRRYGELANQRKIEQEREMLRMSIAQREADARAEAAARYRQAQKDEEMELLRMVKEQKEALGEATAQRDRILQQKQETKQLISSLAAKRKQDKTNVSEYKINLNQKQFSRNALAASRDQKDALTAQFDRDTAVALAASQDQKNLFNFDDMYVYDYAYNKNEFEHRKPVNFRPKDTWLGAKDNVYLFTSNVSALITQHQTRQLQPGKLYYKTELNINVTSPHKHERDIVVVPEERHLPVIVALDNKLKSNIMILFTYKKNKNPLRSKELVADIKYYIETFLRVEKDIDVILETLYSYIYSNFVFIIIDAIIQPKTTYLGDPLSSLSSSSSSSAAAAPVAALAKNIEKEKTAAVPFSSSSSSAETAADSIASRLVAQAGMTMPMTMPSLQRPKLTIEPQIPDEIPVYRYGAIGINNH